MAGADRSDWNLAVALGLGPQLGGPECRAKEERAAASKYCPAIENIVLCHRNDLMNAADESIGPAATMLMNTRCMVAMRAGQRVRNRRNNDTR
jgi:hypothetical protein